MQLVLDFLSLSAASATALTRYPVFTDNDSTIIVESFVSEQLSLIKDVVSETKVPVLKKFSILLAQSTVCLHSPEFIFICC